MTPTIMEDNKDRKQEVDNEEDQKRSILKCDYANVKVSVGVEKEEKVYWHHRVILASQSGMVDTKLATSVGVASEKKDEVTINITEISFPDISPSHWEKMIKFVSNPVAARDMTVDDAMELVMMYDKYDFHTGLKLCDRVLSSMFPKDGKEFKNHIMNDNIDLLDKCVDILELSHENKSLKQTLVFGMKWLYQYFSDYEAPEKLILTVEHIRTLVPIIDVYKDDNKLESTMKSLINDGSSSIDILNPLFPEYFVSQIQLIVSRNTCLKFVNQIKISNCGAPIATIYDAHNDDNYQIDGTCVYYEDSDNGGVLAKNEIGDWIIGRDFTTVLFICTGSRNESLPPKTGWKRIDGADMLDQKRLPVLSYYCNTTEGSTEVKMGSGQD